VPFSSARSRRSNSRSDVVISENPDAYLSCLGRADERTRTADLISSYEFACTRSSPYWYVRELRLFSGFRRSGGFPLSIVHKCVTARLQYGLCSTCVVRMSLCGSGAFTIPYIDPTPNM
jgi:hypothetical protein